jgi:hypothetical protein
MAYKLMCIWTFDEATDALADFQIGLEIRPHYGRKIDAQEAKMSMAVL